MVPGIEKSIGNYLFTRQLPGSWPSSPEWYFSFYWAICCYICQSNIHCTNSRHGPKTARGARCCWRFRKEPFASSPQRPEGPRASPAPFLCLFLRLKCRRPVHGTLQRLISSRLFSWWGTVFLYSSSPSSFLVSPEATSLTCLCVLFYLLAFLQNMYFCLGNMCFKFT